MADRPHSLIIGGTKGLGRVVARRFSELGHAVSVIARNAVPSAALPGAECWNADLLDTNAMIRTVSEITDQRGLFNYVVFAQRYRGDSDPWAGELAVTLTATKVLIDALNGCFQTSGDRAIVLVSSVYAEFVGDSQPVGYHVAKAGLNQMVRYYAMNLGERGIRVNGIMPFTFLKEESKAYYLENKPLHELFEEIIPLGRMGTTEDSANLIEFLCSPKAGFINGQNIFVDGGLSIAWPENLARRLKNI